MIKGSFVADGIALMHIHGVSFVAGAANPLMKAKIAFIKSDSGATLGWTEHDNWSKETLAALAALRSSMEADVASLYLQGGGAGTTGGGPAGVAPLGIADYLKTGEPPSI